MAKLVNPFERDLTDSHTAAEYCSCICYQGSMAAKSFGQASWEEPGCTCECANNNAASVANLQVIRKLK